jgi:hypothetical protein
LAELASDGWQRVVEGAMSVSIIKKLVAGGEGRPTRLHTESGDFLPLKEFPGIPRALAAALLSKVFRTHSSLPWWPLSVIPIVKSALTPHSRVIEFGSGSSTLWLAKNGLSVVSIEDDPAWF